MKVLITGGTGDIGSAASKRFLELGWDVHIIDLKDEMDMAPVTYAKCNIMDFDDLKEQMEGCDAVVHMAAIRAPTIAPNPEVFRINVAGTFNVYEAAAQLGIKRVVQASSINAIGCVWSIGDIHPQYFPLDEEHPRFTTDSYSLSKQMVEDLAEYFYHRDGISGVSFRFPWVYNREKHINEGYFERMRTNRDNVLALFEQSPEDQKKRLERLKTEVLAFRKTRPLEYAQVKDRKHPFAQDHADPLWRFYAFDRFDYWVNLDDRDAAQAIEKSVTSDYEGSHPLFVMAPKNTLGISSRKLAETFYPEVVTWKKDIQGAEALVSSDRARALIGFDPQYQLSLPDA
ncbi:MAG: NAD(P)-dependent oxidoreductase [Trueperaceae bacterium]|nr:NAD(P)-dependent oxidoreductase [Trueperaceae bacterium]